VTAYGDYQEDRLRRNIHLQCLVPRPTNNLIASARQHTTRIWWQNNADNFRLFTSEVVHFEASKGDPQMAHARLEFIASIPRVPVTAESHQLADKLLSCGVISAKAKTDALHLAIATVHHLDFLVTRNCRHLANGEISRQVVNFFRQIGYTPPYMCTPDGLPGVIP